MLSALRSICDMTPNATVRSLRLSSCCIDTSSGVAQQLRMAAVFDGSKQSRHSAAHAQIACSPYGPCWAPFSTAAWRATATDDARRHVGSRGVTWGHVGSRGATWGHVGSRG
eukprot:1427206-Prymnesium_polylepis.1